MERRLFPFKKPTNRLPTVDEILPPTTLLQQQQRMQFNESNTDSESESKHKITRHLQHGNQDTDINDDINVDEDYINDDQDLEPESLQSVESNHVDSYYPEESNEINEGRCFQFEINIFSIFILDEKICIEIHLFDQRIMFVKQKNEKKKKSKKEINSILKFNRIKFPSFLL